MRFIINKKDEYIELTALEAFVNYYIHKIHSPPPLRKIIFYACEGKDFFSIKGEEEFKGYHKGEPKYDFPRFYFTSERILERVDFILLT